MATGYENDGGQNAEVDEVHEEVHDSVDVDGTEAGDVVVDEHRKVLCVEDAGRHARKQRQRALMIIRSQAYEDVEEVLALLDSGADDWDVVVEHAEEEAEEQRHQTVHGAHGGARHATLQPRGHVLDPLLLGHRLADLRDADRVGVTRGRMRTVRVGRRVA